MTFLIEMKSIIRIIVRTLSELLERQWIEMDISVKCQIGGKDHEYGKE